MVIYLHVGTYMMRMSDWYFMVYEVLQAAEYYSLLHIKNVKKNNP